MRSAAFVGRVGGLAVALGVGAAIMTGSNSGIAWADDSGDPAKSAVSDVKAGTDSSAPPSRDADTSETSESEGQDAGEDIAPDDTNTRDSTADDEVSVPDPPDDETDSASSDDQDADDAPAKRHRSETAASRVTPKTLARGVTETDADSDDSAPVIARKSAVADAVGLPSAPDSPSRPSTPMALAVTTKSAVAPPAPSVTTVVGRLVSGVVNAILSPFAASSAPDTGAAMPWLWSLLAFARRQFDSVLRVPATQQTTSQVRAEPEQRTLILSAFPAEADAVLARTTLDTDPTVVVDGHHFYLGTMGGKKVIVAMTGIGMVNAAETTEVALDHFTPESGVSIGAVVFSGVAGGSGRTQIGSVAVPARWTSDDGATWHAVDTGMLEAVGALAVDLESTAPLGDPFCSCNPLARLPIVDLGREPELFVGGDGSSDDNNNGVAFPAIPFGGDIFGPVPCSAPDRSLLSIGNFLSAIGPFLTRGLFTNFTGLLMPVAPAVDAVDQETAAAQQVADAHGIPFLGIRGMSDGPGDPLKLPGYPFTFVVYRQIAADNAAIVTEAFMSSWDGPAAGD